MNNFHFRPRNINSLADTDHQEAIMTQLLDEITDPSRISSFTDTEEMLCHLQHGHSFTGNPTTCHASPDQSYRLTWAFNTYYHCVQEGVIGPVKEQIRAIEFGHLPTDIKLFKREAFGLSVEKVKFKY